MLSTAPSSSTTTAAAAPAKETPVASQLPRTPRRHRGRSRRSRRVLLETAVGRAHAVHKPIRARRTRSDCWRSEKVSHLLQSRHQRGALRPRPSPPHHSVGAVAEVTTGAARQHGGTLAHRRRREVASHLQPIRAQRGGDVRVVGGHRASRRRRRRRRRRSRCGKKDGESVCVTRAPPRGRHVHGVPCCRHSIEPCEAGSGNQAVTE